MEDEDFFTRRHVAEVAAGRFLDRRRVFPEATSRRLQPLVLAADAIEVVREHRVLAASLHHRRQPARAEERFDDERHRRKREADLDQAAEARRRRPRQGNWPGTAGAGGASVVRGVGQRILKIPQLVTKYNLQLALYRILIESTSLLYRSPTESTRASEGPRCQTP